MTRFKYITTVRLIAGLIMLLIVSCENRDWDNPFDPDCPKELFTPANFTAKQEGNVVKLTWVQSNNQITGFVIEKRFGNAAWSVVTNPVKGETTWTDSNISAGKVHDYRLTAKAGSNNSNQVSAQVTPAFTPTITTNAVSYPTPNSATCGGNITNDGGSPVTARGVSWSTSPNPTIANAKTTDGLGTGTFTSNITVLANNTNYYVRAYATNMIGTSYGEQLSFKTLEPNTVVDIEGNLYHIVTIGTQVWMVEDLKTTKFRNGDAIPYYSKTSTRGYCWYNDDVGYKNIYGAIYNYYTAMDSRGICPPGWHIPSNDEWTTLINYLGGESVAGGKLKEAGTTHWTSPNTGATNSTGFTALPGGSRDCENNYGSMGTSCGYWSSKPVSGGWVFGFSLNYGNTKATMGTGFDCNSSYVRCIKD